MPSPRSSALSRALADAQRLTLAGESVEALVAGKIAFAKARRAGKSEAMAAIVSQMAWNCARLGHNEAGLECAAAARRLWARLGNRAEEARATAIEACLLIDFGMSDDAFEAGAAGLAIAEDCGAVEVLIFALIIKATVVTVCREASLGLPQLTDAVDRARAAGLGHVQSLGLLNLGYCQSKLADEANHHGETAMAEHWMDQAIDSTKAAVDAAAACGDLWVRRAALVNLAEYSAQVGELERGLGYLAQAAALLGDPGPSLRGHYCYTLGDLALRQGDVEKARIACTEALEMAEASGQFDHQLNALRQLTQVYEAMGQFETALAMQKRFHAVYVRQSGEAVQKRARVAEIRLESEKWRGRAAELADQAMLDPLTGIGNRRAFDALLGRLEGQSLAIGILDLDMFKAVNDQFSHMVGDAVLQRVAALLLLHAGMEAQVARLGGEEFALVFPGLDIEAATLHCETMRRAVRDADWSDLGAGLAVSVSIGVAAGIGADGCSALLAVADRRLYAAKAAGRNLVVAQDEAPQAREFRVVAG